MTKLFLKKKPCPQIQQPRGLHLPKRSQQQNRDHASQHGAITTFLPKSQINS